MEFGSLDRCRQLSSR